MAQQIYGRGAARAEDAQGTPTQSHVSPSILVYEDYILSKCKYIVAKWIAPPAVALDKVTDMRFRDKRFVRESRFWGPRLTAGYEPLSAIYHAALLGRTQLSLAMGVAGIHTILVYPCELVWLLRSCPFSEAALE